MKPKEYKKATKEDYTHIKFYFLKYTMTVNKSTYKHVFPNAKEASNKYEYLKKQT